MRREHPILPLIMAPVAMAFAGIAAGCSVGGTAPDIGLPTTVGGMPATSATAALQSILTPQDMVVGTPTEAYTRIARGVLTCWFGADGPLKARYIYHAEAEPASKGGSSEIKIMTRDAEADDPRALRAYRILIVPSDGKTKVEVENTKLAEPLAERLKQDVARWSRDEAGCGEAPVTAGWAAEDVVETTHAKKQEKSKKP